MEVFSEYPQNQKYSSYPCVTVSAVKAGVSDVGLGNVVYSTSDSYVTGSTEIIDITIKIYAYVEMGGSYISEDVYKRQVLRLPHSVISCYEIFLPLILPL